MEDRAQRALRALICFVQLSHAKPSDPLGANWCQRKFVGKVRRKVGTHRAYNVLTLGEPAAIDAAATLFADALRDECKACGRCDMARE